MPQLPAIFICYRREDSPGYAGRIYDRLSSHFKPEQIFIDIDNIEPGLDFVEVIENAVGSCDVMLVIIGNQWLNSVDAQGTRRLDNPEDFVRLEIATAIDRNIRVIPVLVHGAVMPRSTDLPEVLTKLARRNAIEIGHARWQYDSAKLIKTLETVLESAKKSPRSTLAKPTPQPVSKKKGAVVAPLKPVKPAAAPTSREVFLKYPHPNSRTELPVEVSDDTERRQHNDAHRFARLLVAEIKLYNEQRVREGRLNNDLYDRLKDEIDRSRLMYDKRISRTVATRYDYFHYELINTLAEGNPARMGKNYLGINPPL